MCGAYSLQLFSKSGTGRGTTAPQLRSPTKQNKVPPVKGWVTPVFFFQAEDGIRDCLLSRGLGDVYKRQHTVPSYQVPGRHLTGTNIFAIADPNVLDKDRG